MCYISVIIPVYNKKPHLKECIESVLKQSYKNYEIIIVDDNSSDGSYEYLCDNYKLNDNISIFRRKIAGAGGYAARNYGISKSKGIWIAFLDADDTWSDNYLEKMYELSQAYPNIKMMSCGWINKIDQNTYIEDTFYNKKKKNGVQIIDLYQLLLYANKKMRPLYTCVIFMKKNAFVDNIFPENKANKGGDLYAFIKYMIYAKEMAWIPFLGATHNIGAVNRVASTPFKSKDLFTNMRYEFLNYIDKRENMQLQRFINRTLFNAWNRNRQLNVENYNIIDVIVRDNDFVFYLYVSLFSMVPECLVKIIRKVKGNKIKTS
jgi:glycosyltransferase involved in cell wall biosynthesis